MKRICTTLFALMFTMSFLTAQQIQRDKVLMEITTGTWCSACPAAANGADEMAANGHDVAIIENHGGDAYENPSSSARNSYYGVQSYPTTIFDGQLVYVGGGSAGSSNYTQYLNRYNQRIDVPSSFSIDIQGSSSGLIDFNVDVTIEMVDTYTADDIRLFCTVTESEIQQTWWGMTHLNFVNRVNIPSPNGLQLDFSDGNTIQQNFYFSLDPEWDTEHCELVVFLQNYTTREVLNASKISLMDFGGIKDHDLSVTRVSNLPEELCAGMISPSIEIRNQGNENLTSFTLKCVANGTELSTFDWTGNLAFMETTTIDLATMSFPAEEINDVRLFAENPNGNPDGFLFNDSIISDIHEPETVPNDIGLMIMLDDHPEETTWELLDDLGNVIYSGGPYSNAGGIIEESFELEDNACYQFYFYDAGGNGLDGKFFALFYGGSTVILRGVDDFGNSLATDFKTDDLTGIEEPSVEIDARVYPNPFSNYTNIVVSTNQLSQIKVNLYNILGELIYQSDEGIHPAGEKTIRISGEKLENGIYFAQIVVNEQVLTRRITLAR